MKKFLTRVILFIAVMISFNLMIGLRLPYYWGNATYAIKVKHLKDYGNKINTVFIGSSATNFTIRPALFDSLTNGNTLSYNLGSPGCLSPENLYLAENFLENIEGSEIMNLIVEVTHGYVKRPQSLNRTYFLNASNFYFGCADILGRTIYDEQRRALLKDLSFNFIKNIFGIGSLKEQLLWTTKDIDEMEDGIITSKFDDNGFTFPYSKQSNKRIDQRLKRSIESVINGLEADSSFNYAPKINARLLERLNEMHETASAKNIKLMFFMYPNVPLETYLEVIPIMRSEAKLNYLNLSDPQCYPFLYDPSNYVDKLHLTYSGSQLFTISMAEQFNMLNNP